MAAPETVAGQVSQLMAPLKADSPRLYQAILLINQQLHSVGDNVDVLLTPVTESVPGTGGGINGDLDTPSIAYEFTDRTVRFDWTQVTGATQYEVRLGSSWDTASFQFRTVNLAADIDALVYGTYNYLIKAMDSNGNYSAGAGSVSVSIPDILPVPITTQVIDNNVLLFWTAPVSVFAIDYYEVFKDGVSLGIVRGTFSSIFEAAAGTYSYRVIAYDIAGNASANSEISQMVNQPPDFILQDDFISTLNGTLSNIVLESRLTPNKLIGPVDTTKTWAQHFSSHGWTNIQDQINAGFPYYGQPTYIAGTPDGSYEEKIDFGSVFSVTIATVQYNQNVVEVGHDVAITVKMAWSSDDITYTAFTTGASQLVTSMRYLKVRLEFNAPDIHSMIEVWNLHVTIQVKREDDGGEIDAISTDVGGTSVVFNKAFKDIDKITATAKSTTALIVVVDFVDIPNPVGFSVYVFNTAGVRQSNRVEWHARGII